MLQYSQWYTTVQQAAAQNPKLAADDWPLLEQRLITGTYQGDLDSSFAIDRVSRRITERAPDWRFDPGVVRAYARIWKNHFDEQWIPGQPMFSIENFGDKAHDVPTDPEPRKRKKEDKPALIQPTVGVTTLVSLPQLNALLFNASEELNRVIEVRPPPASPPPRSGYLPQQQGGQSPPSTIPVVKVSRVRAPVKAATTASEIVTKKSEKEWYDDKLLWKTVVTGRRAIPYANIEYLRKHVRYVGLLENDPEPGIEDGTVLVGLCCTGNVRCHDYWGDDAKEGDSVGFIIKRRRDGNRSYTVEPRKSIDDVPRRKDLEFVDLATKEHVGLFFQVGKIVQLNLMERSRRNPLRCSVVEKLIENPYLGLYGNTVDPNRAYMFTTNAPQSATVSLGANVTNAYALLRTNNL